MSHCTVTMKVFATLTIESYLAFEGGNSLLLLLFAGSAVRADPLQPPINPINPVQPYSQSGDFRSADRRRENQSLPQQLKL